MIAIGGFIPFSLNDFPGHPAAVIFTQGCNFRCPYCHNRDLLMPGPGVVEPEAVLTHLRKRRNVLDAVVITGGEPTLQPELPAFCRILRQMGIRIKLDTNGSRPHVLRALLDEGLLNFIAMDIKAPWVDYNLMGGEAGKTELLRESVNLIATSGVSCQFRTTCETAALSASEREAIEAIVPLGCAHVWQEVRAVRE